MYIGLQVKHPFFLSDFKETLIFSKEFRKMLKYKFSWKSVLWEPSCYMRADGRTDKHEANSRSGNFWKAPKKWMKETAR